MKCPVCNRKIQPLAMIFSMLPWWVRCNRCKSKLTLINKKLFWIHVGIFAVIVFPTSLLFIAIKQDTLAYCLVAAEALIFVALIATVWMPAYGLKPIEQTGE